MEQCINVVPIILMYSESVRFYCVYLAADNCTVPVVVCMSRSLDYKNVRDSVELAVWLDCMITCLQQTCTELSKLPPGGSKTKPWLVDGTGCFYKHIRAFPKSDTNSASRGPSRLVSGKRIRLSNILPCMRVCTRSHARASILFPIGYMSMPDPATGGNELYEYLLGSMKQYFKRWTDIEIGSPLLMYKTLVGRTNTKPHALVLGNLYKEKVAVAVEVMNQAKVAHMDLRPENIIWTVCNDELRVMVIDFEDCRFFQEQIPEQERYEDVRYPF